MKPKRNTRGAQLLNAHLRETGITYTRFAADMGVSAITAYQWMRGEMRPKVDFWALIEQPTRGAVPVISWTENLPPNG